MGFGAAAAPAMEVSNTKQIPYRAVTELEAVNAMPISDKDKKDNQAKDELKHNEMQSISCQPEYMRYSVEVRPKASIRA